MNDESVITDCEVFATYAGDSLEAWKRIKGQHLVHKSLGSGEITTVEPGPSQDSIRPVVRFDQLPAGEDEKRFPTDSLASFFDELTLPADLEGLEATREHLEKQHQEEEAAIELEREKQRKREEEQTEAERQRRKESADAAHLARLKSKYSVEYYDDASPSSPLYAILLLLEDGRSPDDKQIDWLEHEKLFEVIAWSYEMAADKAGDQWNIPRASRYWRMARRPRRVVIITEEFDSSDGELMSAILTTRGAALRDLSDLPEAARCAHAALEHNPDNFRTYNLLGAISYQHGNPRKGDEYFAKAVELGANPEMQDSSIRSSLSAAGEISRREVALYLLEKDPERYSWAEYYLKRS
jgi:tetratricopeptide (TPR) repeat protein